MIRKAETKDIDGILKLLDLVHTIHYEGRPDIFKKGTTKYNRNDLNIIIKDSKRPIFVYDLDGIIAGYVFCIVKSIKDDNNFKDYDYLFIDDICVLEEYQRRNIGSSLYDYAKNYAKELNLKSIRLNVWNFNEKAYKFYTKKGMKVLESVMEETL